MKKFIAYFLVVSTLSFAAVAYCNYLYDGTGVLNRDLSGVRMTPNQAFCKVRYVLENPDRYDSFCFGSSRVTALNLNRINDGGKWYNMTYAAGSPQMWLHDLRLLLDQGVHVSTVLVGIDDLSCNEEPIEKKQADAYKHPYERWDFSYYMGLLLHKPSALPSPLLAQEKGSIFDLYGTGRTYSPWIDEQAEKNPEKYKKEPRFLLPYIYPDNGQYEAQLEALRKLKQLADENNIKIVFFMNPVAAATYLNEDKAVLKRWKRDIAAITDFYDFTGMNEINTDNLSFLETSHYREITGDRMIDRMMNGAPEAAPGFGFLVTAENLDEHETMLAMQERSWLETHPLETEWFNVGRGLASLPSDFEIGRAEEGMAFNLDVIDGHEFMGRQAEHRLSQELVVGGWFLTAGKTPEKVLLCLTGKDGKKRYTLLRQDFNQDLIGKLSSSDDPAHAWFFAHVDVSSLPAGLYDLSFVAEAKDGKYWRTGQAALLNMVL